MSKKQGDKNFILLPVSFSRNVTKRNEGNSNSLKHDDRTLEGLARTSRLQITVPDQSDEIVNCVRDYIPTVVMDLRDSWSKTESNRAGPSLALRVIELRKRMHVEFVETRGQFV